MVKIVLKLFMLVMVLALSLPLDSDQTVEANRINEETALTHSAGLKMLVEQLADEGEIVHEGAVRALTMHLTAVDHLEKQGDMEKVIKHLESFKLLLTQHRENEWISETAYSTLESETDAITRELSKPDAYTIVSSGEAKAVIIIPDDPIEVENYAADELQYHVREATGTTLQIQSESEPNPKGLLPIYLGRTQSALANDLDGSDFGPRSFAIRTTGQGIYIVGHDEDGAALDLTKDAGTLFGVYEILRNDMQVKWLWPGTLGEEIPKISVFSIPEYDIVQEAQLQHTRWRSNTLLAEVEGISPLIKSDYIKDQSVWLRRHGFAEGISLNYGHGFTDYWDRFKDTQLDFFNLLPDGTRRPFHPFYPGAGALISMNVGNEALQNQVITEWLANRTDKEPWVNGIENDTPGLDRSPESLAMDNTSNPYPVPEGKEDIYLPYSLSDRYAKWYLALQQKARLHDPNAKVIGYAYENYSAPPVETQLNKDVVIGIVPSYIFPWSEQNREEFRTQWKGWYDKGASLYLRPNYTLSGHNMPVQYAKSFGEDFSYSYSKGMIGTDFDSLTGMFAAQGPSLYMVARMHEAQGLSVESILDEYYDAFGPAKPKIKQYFEHWENVTKRAEQAFLTLDIAEMHVDSVYADFHKIVDLLFLPDDFAVARSLLNEAGQHASGDDKVVQRIDFLAKGLHDAELTRELMAINRLVMEDPTKEPELIEAVQELDNYRRSIASSHAVNVWYATWAENRTINRELYKVFNKYEQIQNLPTTWDFAFDPENEGEFTEWFRNDAEVAWDSIGIDTVWGNQPIGIEWKQQHGSDFNGVGWYRTTFNVTELTERLSLLFGAVDKSARVWVNGVLAGDNIYDPVTHPNAWKDPFVIPLDDLLHVGNNTVVVQVESLFGAGGIYKPVWLVRNLVSDPISLSDDSVEPIEVHETAVSPETRTELHDGFKLYRNPVGSENHGIELLLDLETEETVSSLQFMNRPSATTNLAIRNAKVSVGSADDGVHFDKEIYHATVPGTNAAGEIGTINFSNAVKKRYFKLIVTSNFFGELTNEAVNRNLIQVGPFHFIGMPPVTVIHPNEKANHPGFVMYTNPEAAVNGSVDLLVDLGKPEQVMELQVINRPMATNLSVKAATIWVGTNDDGETFDQRIYNGIIPGSNAASEVRSIMVTPAKKRYFKIEITDNFFGPINGQPNQTGVQLTELRYVTRLDTE